jgi:alkanesulfonate monooxygenase SsuD/methylene tetrahydromethanopterin reductase-like flavin-dependent oxidoreductase (luciferase family)
MHWDDVKGALYPDTAEIEDFSYERVARLLRLVGGEPASTFSGREGVVEEWSDRVQPHSPGLRDRLWYGGGSLGSARWAGEHGMNFLTSSVVKAEQSGDFAEIQRSHIRAFRAAHPAGAAARVSQGLVVIPTDSATAAQRAKYTAYVEARTPRTTTPQGPARLLFAPDILGTLGGDRRGAVRARRVPGGHRGRLRAALQLRRRGLRADAHRRRYPPGSGAGLAATSARLSPTAAGRVRLVVNDRERLPPATRTARRASPSRR